MCKKILLLVNFLSLSFVFAQTAGNSNFALAADTYSKVTFTWTIGPIAIGKTFKQSVFSVINNKTGSSYSIPVENASFSGGVGGTAYGSLSTFSPTYDFNPPYNYTISMFDMYTDLSTSSSSNTILYNAVPSRPVVTSCTYSLGGYPVLNWSFTPSATDSDVVGYYVTDQYNSFYGITDATSTSLTLQGINPYKSYNFYVSAIDYHGNINKSVDNGKNTITSDYCSNNLINQTSYYSDFNFISQVKLKTLSFPSPNPAAGNYYSTYANFSNSSNMTVPTLFIGASSADNILSVTVANNSLRDAHIYAAIDYNYNGVFEKSEQITMGSLNYNGGRLPNIATMSGSTISAGIPLTFVSNQFIVPELAYQGKVKMRIMYSRYNILVDDKSFKDANLSCSFSSIFYPNTGIGYEPIGQVQDYDVMLYKSTVTNRTSTNVTTSAAEIKPSVTNDADILNFVLYPNPVSGDVMNITLVDDNTPYRIINILGQEVGVGTVKRSTISVDKLNSGSYLVEILVENQRIVKRFIKQ